MRSFLLSLVIAPLLCAPVTAQCGTSYRSRAYSSYSYSYTPSYSYAAPVYAEKVKVVKEVVPTFVTYQAVIPYAYALLNVFPSYGAQAVPAYGSGHYAAPTYPSFPNPGVPAQPGPNPQQQAPNGNGQSAELKQILDAVKSIDGNLRNLDARVRALEERAAPKTAPKREEEPRKEESRFSIPDPRTVTKASCVMCHERGKEADGGGIVLFEADGNLVKMSAKTTAKWIRHVERGTMPPAKAVSAGKAKPLDDLGAAALKNVAFSQDEERERASKGG